MLKNKLLLSVVLLLIIICFCYFLLDLDLISKFFVKRDFNNAFLARQTGNCDEFEKYFLLPSPNDLLNLALGGEKEINTTPLLAYWCKIEKDSGGSIKNFKVLNITINSDRAYLQIELKKDNYFEYLDMAKKGHKPPESGYLVNYEMKKVDGRWYFVN